MTRRPLRSDAIRERAARVLFVALVAAPATASAQSAPDAVDALSEQARRLFAQGLDALDRGRLVEAAQHFERSYRLRPAAVVLINLAVVYRSQGRYLESQAMFVRALREGASELLPDELARARNDLARLELAIPTVRFDGLVEGAQLRCDGRTIDGVGPSRTLRLDPGTHVFDITAPRHEPEQRTLRMDPSTQQSVALRMRRAPQPRLWIALPSTVTEANVMVDGAPWPHAGQPREVLAGSHRVRVLAAGFAPFDRTVTVLARTTVRLDVTLTRANARVAGWVIATASIAAALAVTAIPVSIALTTAPEPLPVGLWDGPVSTPSGTQR